MLVKQALCALLLTGLLLIGGCASAAEESGTPVTQIVEPTPTQTSTPAPTYTSYPTYTPRPNPTATSLSLIHI